MDNEVGNVMNHYEKLGRLLAAFHQLEVALRAYLLTVEDATAGIDYVNLKEGEEVVDDEMTNYDSLGNLVKKYNKSIESHSDIELVVDSEVVSIRNLMAHGRVLSLKQDMANLRIFKFSKNVCNGKRKVEHAVLFNDDWYNRNGALIDEQNEKVSKAIAKYTTVVDVKVAKRIDDAPVMIKSYK